MTVSVLVAVLLAMGVSWLPPSRGHVEFQDPAAGAKAAAKRTIQTHGTATVLVKPDHGRVFLSVQTTAATVKEARTQNSGHVNKVMAAIQALGLADLKMKSTNLHMEPVYSQEEKKDKLPKLLGYRVSHTFTVLVRNDDPAKLSAAAARVLDTAVENGVNNVEKVVFFKADLTATRREALHKATEDALANANAIAEGAKVSVAEVAHLEGSPEFRGHAQPMSNSIVIAGAGGDGTALVAGEVEITCRISVTCNLAEAKK